MKQSIEVNNSSPSFPATPVFNSVPIFEAKPEFTPSIPAPNFDLNSAFGTGDKEDDKEPF